MAAPSQEGYAQAWLDYEAILGARPLLVGSTDELHEQFNGLLAAIAAQSPPPDPSVKTRDETADGVPVRIYTPDGASGKKLPLGVYYHGGGYVLGNLDSEDAWCRYIAKNTPAIIVSVEYRLAPKYKHPAMLDDSLAGFNWAYKNAESLGADQGKVFTTGASAGGGLALTVADQVIKAGNSSHVAGIVAMVPVTAHSSSIPAAYKPQYTAFTENASGVPIIDASTMKTFFEASGTHYNDEKVFVTLSNALAKFPKTYIATCGKDPLRDDGRVLKTILEKEGVKTKHDNYDGVPHYFWMFPGIEGREEFLGNVVKGVQWVFE